jgi:hypothetical protein
LKLDVAEWGYSLEVSQKEYTDDYFGFPSVPFVDKLDIMEEHTDVEVLMTLDEKSVDDIEAQGIKNLITIPVSVIKSILLVT